MWSIAVGPGSLAIPRAKTRTHRSTLQTRPFSVSSTARRIDQASTRRAPTLWLVATCVTPAPTSRSPISRRSTSPAVPLTGRRSGTAERTGSRKADAAPATSRRLHTLCGRQWSRWRSKSFTRRTTSLTTRALQPKRLPQVLVLMQHEARSSGQKVAPRSAQQQGWRC